MTYMIVYISMVLLVWSTVVFLLALKHLRVIKTVKVEMLENQEEIVRMLLMANKSRPRKSRRG